jgi:hypothetical protein
MNIWPLTAQPALSVGGVYLTEIAERFGTPVYVLDEEHVRARCREYAKALAPHEVAYASKAFWCRAMARWIAEEGLSLDVCSEGELVVAGAAGFPAERILRSRRTLPARRGRPGHHRLRRADHRRGRAGMRRTGHLGATSYRRARPRDRRLRGGDAVPGAHCEARRAPLRGRGRRHERQPAARAVRQPLPHRAGSELVHLPSPNR